MRGLTQKITLCLAGIVLALLSINVTAQESTEVHARLRLAETKTKYRIGEPIRLILELTADREGFTADVTQDTHEPPTDLISISPDTGAQNWLVEYLRGNSGYRDYFHMANLKPEPATIDVILNDSIRFDRPGKYSVKVTTRRVSPISQRDESRTPLTLTTNEVSFEIEAMSEAEEEQEIKRIGALIDAAKGWQAEEATGRQLSYITGDLSAREKVRRFVADVSKSSNYHAQIMYGLFIARNRALVVQLLEAVLRDPDTPVSYGLLNIAAQLRLLRETAGAPVTPVPPRSMLMPRIDPRFAAIRDAYLTELAVSLDKRSGKSLTTTAMTILMNLPQDAQASSAFSSQARSTLISQFDNLHPNDQEYLLLTKWDYLRDVSLVPSLKKMLAGIGSGKTFPSIALKRLLEIAPDEARPFVIAMIRAPMALFDPEILANFPHKTLPEVDTALLEQIRQFANPKVSSIRIFLQHKTGLAARYASKTIYADLLAIYREAGDTLPVDTRAGFLAYFARHNEEEGISLLKQTLETLTPGQDFNVLPEFAKLYFSEAVDELLRQRLESDVQETASTAAYLISLYGSAADQKVLELRLERWHKELDKRIAEADANHQGRVESELIGALVRGKSWKLTPAQAKELQSSCLTKVCKQNQRVQ